VFSLFAVAIAAGMLWACDSRPGPESTEAEASRQTALRQGVTPAFRNLGKSAEGARPAP